MAALIGGAIAGAGALGSGLLGSSASKKAASTQANAANQAAQLQLLMFQQTAARLQPFVSMGTSAAGQLGGFLGLPGATYAGGPGGFTTGAGVRPFQPTMAQLEQTPGYQFTLAQGEQATTNAAAAMGLGQSGSLLKSLDQYTTGLASQTYQQQFNNYWAQLQQTYNMLAGATQTGENAAAMTGQQGGAAAGTAGSFIGAAGSALGQGTLNAAGSVMSPLNALTQFGLASAFTGGSGSGTSTGTSPLAAIGNYLGISSGIGTPSGSSLIANPGDPASLQSALSLPPGQFVP